MSIQKEIPVDNPPNNAQLTSYSRSEEMLNALSHGIGLFLSFLALFLLLDKSHGDNLRIISFSVFTASGMLLFCR